MIIVLPNTSARWGITSTLEARTHLATALRDLRRRTLSIGATVAAGWSLAAGLLALILFAWLDLILDLPGGVRLILGLLALATAAVLAARLVRRAMLAASDVSMAQKLDTAVGAAGQIVSGVALATADHTHQPPLTAGLAQLAISRAAGLMFGVNSQAVLPARGIRRPYLLLGFTLLFIAALSILSPRLARTQLLRFVDPFGDHPPYSPLIFTLDPGNTRVLYGGSLDVRATVTGGAPDRLDLVLSTTADPPYPLPMFPEGAGQWRATLTNLTADATYRVGSGRARSDQYTLSIITVPKLTDVRFHVTLPAYTHRPPYDGPLPQNGIAGLAGTRVEVHAKSNRPLSTGTIHFAAAASSTQPTTPDITMTPTAANASEVVGAFQITTTGKATIAVTDIAGQPSTETLTVPITLLQDQRPIVRMIEPRPESFATPDATIKVQALAEDDYGLSAVSIYRSLNDSTPRPTAIPIPADPPSTQFPANLMLHLADYKLNPGDVIQLFARALDNDPAGPKGSDSTVVTLRIVSQKDMDRMTLARDAMEALQSKYAAAARRAEAADAALAKLEKEIAAADPDKPLTDAQKKQLAEESAELAKAAAEVNKLAAHDLPFDLDHALTAQLRDMAAAMQNAADAASSAAKPGLSAAGALDKLRQARKSLGTERNDFNDNATLPLDQLAKIFPLIQDQARFLDIAAHQKDLAARMAAVQSSTQDDPAAKAHMRDLQDEQQQVRQDLRQLLDDIDNHVAALPDDKRLDELRNTATKFSAAVRASPAAGQMQDAESALENFTPDPAHTAAVAAADTLDQFISRCQGMGQQATVCLKFQPKLSAGLGNTVDQMLQSMSLSTGMGASGVGGYSAARSSLANVGLYGTLPVNGQESGSQPGGHADRGLATTANGLLDDNTPGGAGAAGQQQAGGQSDVPVPPQYKQKVGDYFQRVSDELSN